MDTDFEDEMEARSQDVIYDIPWSTGWMALREPIEIEITETETGVSVFSLPLSCFGFGEDLAEAIEDFALGLEMNWEHYCSMAPLDPPAAVLVARMREHLEV